MNRSKPAVAYPTLRAHSPEPGPVFSSEGTILEAWVRLAQNMTPSVKLIGAPVSRHPDSRDKERGVKMVSGS